MRLYVKNHPLTFLFLLTISGSVSCHSEDGYLSLDNDTVTKLWPWSHEPSEAPPKFKPYKIPTLSGNEVNFRHRPPAFVKAPMINPDFIYNALLSCYPANSHWDLDIRLRAQLRTNEGFFTDDTGSTEIGSNYVAIIANLPLYSGKELDREREREYRRRTDLAKLSADFVTAIAQRNHAIRELAIYRALETRSALRVQNGIAPANEQISYLEKVAKSQQQLIKAEGKIMENRVTMYATCEPVQRDHMNHYLRKVAAYPAHHDFP